MKIKGKFQISKSVNLIIFLLITVVLTIMRFIDVKTNIDPITGFYTNTHVLGFVTLAVLILGFVIYTVISVLSTDCNINNLNNNSKSSGICTLMLSLSFILDFIFVRVFTKNTSMDMFDANTARILTLTSIIGLIFSVLSVIYFLIVFNDNIKDTHNAQNKKILALSPVILFIVNLVSLFVTKISFLRVSDLFLQIISLVFTVLFFMSYAQVKNGIYSEGNVWKLYSYGLSATSVLLVINIPKVIFTIFDHNLINNNYPLSLLGLGIAIFILGLLFSKNKEILTDSDN